MTTRTWRISPHTEPPFIRTDRLATLANALIPRDRLRLSCSVPSGTNPHSKLKVAGNWISRTRSTQSYPSKVIAQATNAVGANRRTRPHPNGPAFRVSSGRLSPSIVGFPRAPHPPKASTAAV